MTKYAAVVRFVLDSEDELAATIKAVRDTIAHVHQQFSAPAMETVQPEMPTAFPTKITKRHRRCYSLDERVQKFESKSTPQAAPSSAIRQAKRQGLKGTLHGDSPCSRLLDVILANLTLGQDGYWYFLGALRLAADLAQVHHTQARRCMRRFKEKRIVGRIRQGSALYAQAVPSSSQNKRLRSQPNAEICSSGDLIPACAEPQSPVPASPAG